jgi:4-hydroxy-2-oxoheptanedioate aldolase
VKSDPTILGIWQQFPLPMVSRLLGQMGWEWVILDMQHGAMTTETAYECIHTLRTAGAKPLVRVGVGVPGEVQRALDLGARGVVVPMVNSVAEAQAVAQAAKYPPLGCRSLGGDAAWHYGEDYPEHANTSTLLLVQVEHIDAVNCVEEMMALPGVDGCFIGPTDLALSMGLPRKHYDQRPEHRAAMARTLAACQKSKKLACVNTYSLSDAQEKIDQSYDCITFRSEAEWFVSAGHDLLAELRRRAGN